MKRFVFVHGFRATHLEPSWMMWAAKKLQAQGHEVHVPDFPNSSDPQQREWVKKLEEIIPHDGRELVLVGHSLGGLAILKYLEEAAMRAHAVLVGTPFEDVEKAKILNFLPPFDWQVIKRNLSSIAYFYSKDDPHVPFDHGEKFQKFLTGKLFSFEDRGHFEQPIFDELLEYLIDY